MPPVDGPESTCRRRCRGGIAREMVRRDITTREEGWRKAERRQSGETAKAEVEEGDAKRGERSARWAVEEMQRGRRGEDLLWLPRLKWIAPIEFSLLTVIEIVISKHRKGVRSNHVSRSVGE